MDILSYFLLIMAFFLRHVFPSQTVTDARRMFSLSLLVMYLRFLEVFLVHRKMGPTLIMIKEMVNTYYLTQSFKIPVLKIHSDKYSISLK